MGGETSERQSRSDAKLTTIEGTLKELKKEFETISKKLSGMESKLNMQAKLVEAWEELKLENAKVMTENKEIKAENEKINNRLKKIEADMESQARNERRNAIEIMGIPKKNDENVYEILGDLVKHAKLDLKKEDIVSCYRVNTRNERDGKIVIKFKDTRKRDIAMKDLKKSKPRLADINQEPKQRKVFVNESLTQRASNIYYKARRLVKEKSWDRAWTFAGEVFIRQEREGNNIKIESEQAIEILK